MQKFLIGCLLFLAACQPADIASQASAAPSTATHTPPATASPTPEPTATSTPVPTALPRYFTEEFDGSVPMWSVLQSNGGSPAGDRIQDGALIFDLPASNMWVYALIGAEAYADVRIDARAQSRASGPDAIGLICRYSEQNGWYEFNVSGDRTYNVLFGRWLADGIAHYTPIAYDTSEYLNPMGAENEIGMACEGANLWLYLNGKLFRKLDVSRFGLTEGKVGLSIASFENLPVSAAFEWVKVGEPTEE